MPHGFAHRDGGDDAGKESQSTDYSDSPLQAENVCNHAGEKRANGIAEVAPETINRERTRSPFRRGDIAYHGDQRRIDHRRAHAQERGATHPPYEGVSRNGKPNSAGLECHAPDDKRFTTQLVGQRASNQLADGPHGGISKLQRADGFDRQISGGEKKRQDAPTHSVVQIVHEASLTRAK